MKRFGLFLALVGLIVGSLHAVELAPGLAYLRPGLELIPETGSAVLDLRFVADAAAAVPLLAAVHPGNANDHRVILALVSPETPAGLRRQLTSVPRCLTVGRAAPGLKTDIVVTTSAEADRRAFDALVAGTPPKKLLVENVDKARYDETALIRDYTGGPAPVNAAQPATVAPAAPASVRPADPANHHSAADSPASPADSVITDAVLQRAVQIHRGLVVLKKL